MTMASLNKVQIIGNLGRDPESRTTQSGSTIVTLSVATSAAARWTVGCTRGLPSPRSRL
jgi:single-stranded DNA-binding protein